MHSASFYIAECSGLISIVTPNSEREIVTISRVAGSALCQFIRKFFPQWNVLLSKMCTFKTVCEFNPNCSDSQHISIRSFGINDSFVSIKLIQQGYCLENNIPLTELTLNKNIISMIIRSNILYG